jgi:hypothetical protein
MKCVWDQEREAYVLVLERAWTSMLSTHTKLMQFEVDCVELSYIFGMKEAAKRAGVDEEEMKFWRGLYRAGMFGKGVKVNAYGVTKELVEARDGRAWKVPIEVANQLTGNVVEIEGNYFSSPMEMMEKIEEYFLDCDERGASYTVAGMVLWLGLSRVESLTAYKLEEGYNMVLNRAFLRMEQQRNERLLDDPKAKTAGIVRDLEKHFGWDKDGRVDEAIGVPAGMRNGEEPRILNQQMIVVPQMNESLGDWQKKYQKVMGSSHMMEVQKMNQLARNGVPAVEIEAHQKRVFDEEIEDGVAGSDS